MSTTIDLSGFTGSTQWFRQPMFPRYRYTEGVQYLAEAAHAYWLIDAVMSWQLDPAIKATPFQVWTLKVNDSKAVLSVTDGNEQPIGPSNKPVAQEISFTDFPMPEVTLWFTDNCLLLPSEY